MRLLRFITGIPRSGTTIVSTSMDRLPRVYVPKETHFFECLSAKSNDQKRRRVLRKIFNENDLTCSFESYADSLPLLYSNLITSIVQKKGAQVLIEKTPNHYKYLDQYRFEQKIKVVHLIRDPRDVYLSRKGLPWGRKAVLSIVEEFKTSSDFATQGHDFGVVKPIKYEDLIARPDSVMEEICAFLELPYSQDMLAPSSETTSFDVKEEYWKKKNLSQIDPANRGKWRRQRDFLWCKALTYYSRDALNIWGYEVYPVSLSLMNKVILHVECVYDFQKSLFRKLKLRMLRCLSSRI